MPNCPSCGSEIGEGLRFCGHCGVAVDKTSAPTETSLEEGRRGTQSSFDSADRARFLPGTILAKRYRIIGLLGRGGMGEVYRADDLKLGQAVALKFLPAAVEKDQARLNRFLNEVKTALKVTHPNVCRVYDIGEVDGQHYLSMEYVDGEDLASLLRRIERLPQNKAVQIARQICAGLAAAHDEGILHRDLKPANIMIDGRGRAKIADFGLAGLAAGIEGDEVRAGTAQYMAPEQHAGKEVTVRSDIYSLGLVLYELFTGKRAFEAATPAEIARLQEESTPTNPSSHVEGFDPAVERIILRCLEKEAAARPQSVLAVAAALPGGDPLAAALAAGETPSPEMVAAAGPQGGLRPGVAMACLAAVVLGCLVIAFLVEGDWICNRLPFTKSYAALKENAREIATRVGYSDSPRYDWAGFEYNWVEYFHLVQEHGVASLGDHLGEAGQLVFLFRHRQSSEPIVPPDLDGQVTWSTPAPETGEVAMLLDLQGHLVELRATPSRNESEEEAAEVDWAILFEVAGLDIEQFEPTSPTIRPESFADSRVAWTGVLPDYGDRPVRIEAAALDGRAIYFEKIVSSSPRWTTEGGQQPEFADSLFTTATVILLIIAVLIVGGGVFLAVRNLRLGRGDRKGAFRIASFVFSLRMLHWALAGDHVGDAAELYLLAVAVSGATALALLAWTVYVACEPYVRRLWPQTMVSWSRVLAGRFRDPLVGRDVLVGCTFLTGVIAIQVTAFWIAERLAIVGILPDPNTLVVLRGGRFAVGELFKGLLVNTCVAFGMTMILLLFRMICRKTWIAATLLCLITGAFSAMQLAGVFGPQAAALGLFLQATVFASAIFVLLRFGLLALVASSIFGGMMTISPFTFDTSAPYFGIGLFVTLVAFGFAAYGWKISLAGRPLLQDSILDR